ncbi:calaxin [Frankliniella occidentalis]|uniref:Calaxin n=1 Tax=Frankliniella occidentalis TaxID=133901 RepID=A0A6J1S7F9_FRAOC|nr:calaxin [Frankliniella occidentalis]
MDDGGGGGGAGAGGGTTARSRARQQGNSGGKTSAKLMEYFKRKTHFSREEIESLCRVYRKLVATSHAHNSGAAVLPPPNVAVVTEGLDRVAFRELLHNTFDMVTEEVLMDRIFCAFDRCNDGVIRMDEWVCGLSVFIKGDNDERTAFCFRVYDLNSDGHISREEMFHLLRNCLVKQPQDDDPDEGVKDLVELALKKLDYDKDGKVSFKDFQAAVKDEPLLLEAFGQCLPSGGACQTFLSTLRS